MNRLGWFGGPVLVAGSIVGLMGYGSFAQKQDDTEPNITATLVDCRTEPSKVVARVRVTNDGVRTRTVRVHLTYHRGQATAGDSLAVFWTLKPSTSAEKDEKFFPAQTAGISCSIASVDWSAGS